MTKDRIDHVKFCMADLVLTIVGKDYYPDNENEQATLLQNSIDSLESAIDALEDDERHWFAWYMAEVTGQPIPYDSEAVDAVKKRLGHSLAARVLDGMIRRWRQFRFRRPGCRR